MVHTICLTHLVPKDDPALEMLMHHAKSKKHEAFSFYLMRPSEVDEFGEVWRWCFRLVVDCLKLFNVRNIGPSEAVRIIPAINDYLVGTGLDVDDFNLTRIDYAYSHVVTDPEERECIFAMLQKCTTKAKYTKREKIYKTSLRRESKSKAIQVYDKNAERRWRGVTARDYERNVIRTETQVLREHLKSQKRATGTPRSLKTWLTWERYRKYIAEAWAFVYQGDFYPLETAIKMIAASDNSKVKRNRLIAFVTTIAAYDVDTAKATMKSPRTYKEYIARLDKLGVNPITIPEDYKIAHISNPFKFF